MAPGKYKVGDNIGKFGLEQKQEDFLRGVDGEDIKEVDALGPHQARQEQRPRARTPTPDRPPSPARTSSSRSTRICSSPPNKAFGDKIGAMVAIDPRNGEILAMLSRPSFDPTEFSRGIPAALWNKLLNNENHPLRDKTIQDHYPPGSTFKIVTAIAGLEENVIDEHTHLPLRRARSRSATALYHCHKKGGHGNVNVVTRDHAELRRLLLPRRQKLKSVDDIAKWAFKLGLGRKTGVTLAREVPGLIPTEEWKMKRFKQPWNAGETVNVAIGQGYVLTTAIQLANALRGHRQRRHALSPLHRQADRDVRRPGRSRSSSPRRSARIPAHAQDRSSWSSRASGAWSTARTAPPTASACPAWTSSARPAPRRSSASRPTRS